MGRTDALDRVAQTVVVLVAALAAANGAVMLADPFGWYQAVPTVKFTGPPNQHFLRDIGLAYLTSALLLGYAGHNLGGRWLFAVAGNIWLSLHGAFHIAELAAGICAPGVFWRDAPGVLGPPLLVWGALAVMAGRQRIAPAGLPRRVLIAALDRRSPGELGYLREIGKAPGHAFEKLAHFIPITMHRHDAPATLFHMARIGATLVEDCGPCALTVARAALADGVARETIDLALAARLPAGDLRLAFEFGQAIGAHDASAGELGEAVERAHGRTVRLELALTAATVHAYPAIKRGLGLATPCGMTPVQL